MQKQNQMLITKKNIMCNGGGAIGFVFASELGLELELGGFAEEAADLLSGLAAEADEEEEELIVRISLKSN